jgi:hypothetical protein
MMTMTMTHPLWKSAVMMMMMITMMTRRIMNQSINRHQSCSFTSNQRLFNLRSPLEDGYLPKVPSLSPQHQNAQQQAQQQ